MQTKLRSIIPHKQTDNHPYSYQQSQSSHRKKLTQHLQPHTQNINFSQSKFFANCEDLLKNIADDAKNEQKVIQHKKKMKELKEKVGEQSGNRSKVDQMLLTNIVIDYCRSNQMNYTYSMVMREKNIVSEEVVMKGQLAEVLDLKQQLHQDPRLNISILELLLTKLTTLQSTLTQRHSTLTSASTQCSLLSASTVQPNSILLTELKLQQIRQQTQKREKKHYESMMHLFKSQELMKLKEDITRIYEVKEGKMREMYEERVREVVRGSTSEGKGGRQERQVEQYLAEIESLKRQVRTLKDHSSKLQRQSLEHDCHSNPQIKQRLQDIAQERRLLQEKRQEFQLALRNMSTKVEDMAMQKQKILTDNNKQTEEFLTKMKTHRENKDYMIEKVYSTLRGFEMRIENLSSDNGKLYTENQLLRNQLASLKKANSQALSRYESQTKNRTTFSDLKIPTKTVSIGVVPEDLSEQQQMEQSMAQSKAQSVLTYTSQQFEHRMREKKEQEERINRLKMEMGVLKSKVKFLVMDFQ